MNIFIVREITTDLPYQLECYCQNWVNSNIIYVFFGRKTIIYFAAITFVKCVEYHLSVWLKVVIKRKCQSKVFCWATFHISEQKLNANSIPWYHICCDNMLTRRADTYLLVILIFILGWFYWSSQIAFTG